MTLGKPMILLQCCRHGQSEGNVVNIKPYNLKKKFLERSLKNMV